jgi:N-carbamoylputrescine amidase
MKTTVAAIQLQASTSLDENLFQAQRQVLSATKNGARIVVMPEIFSAPFVTGEVDLDYFSWAEPLMGPTNSMIAKISSDTKTTIISSFFEASEIDGVFHNTAVTFHDGQIVHTYRKSHLPFSNAFPEKFYFRPGSEPPSAVQCGEVKIGTIVCYERHFPELGRLVALTGGQLMAVPVACASAPTRDVFQVELRAQAIFNELFVVCANRIGQEGTKNYYGTSAIYGPDGTILAQGSTDQVEVVASEIDIDAVQARRVVLPFLRDRRVDLYGGLVS